MSRQQQQHPDADALYSRLRDRDQQHAAARDFHPLDPRDTQYPLGRVPRSARALDSDDRDSRQSQQSQSQPRGPRDPFHYPGRVAASQLPESHIAPEDAERMLRMLKGDARRHGAYVRGAQPPRHGSAAAFYQAAYAQYLNAVAEELDVHPGWLDAMIDPDENFDELKLRAALRREAAYRAQLESAELGHPVARGPAAHVQSAATKFELAMRGGLGEEEMRRGGGGGGRGGR